MIRRVFRLGFSLLSVVIIALAAGGSAIGQGKKNRKSKSSKAQPPTVSYTVSMPKPWTHLLHVEMRMMWDKMPADVEIKMPVWTPGSYLVREYSKHVQDFVAVDGAGNTLNWKKSSKNTWKISTNGAKGLRIGYRVYSNVLTVRTNELNYEHAFFTPAALFMYPSGYLNIPSTVTVNPYKNWKVATGLPAVEGRYNTFRAENYDTLFDSPFEVSDFAEKVFYVQGKKHRFVVTGEGNYDLDRITADTAKMIEVHYQLFGELPYEDYTFILNLRGGGGLEHLNSTALQWNRFGFKPEPRYTAFLSLIAHEFFHLYMVKRIRPEPLGPFDYENENYTKLLWVAEGLTSYYEGILMKRAGLVKANYILRNEANIIGSLYRQPGRFQTSLEEASFDAWIKYYRRDENAVNNQISYYSKGDLVNFLLDLSIRAGSGGQRSMDSVLQYLYAEFYKKNKNFSPADFQKACELAAGVSLEKFFNSYVRGRDEIDANPILEKFGLRLISRLPKNDRAYLGANLSESNGRLTISSVPADTPAYEWGLNARDQIVAINGYRASRSRLNSMLRYMKAGETIDVTVFRHNKLRVIKVKLGETPASGYAIIPVDNPTEEQKRMYREYFGEELVATP